MNSVVTDKFIKERIILISMGNERISTTILVGNEVGFLNDMIEFSDYLTNEVKTSQINIIRGAFLTNNQILENLNNISEEAKEKRLPVVLFYTGHGDRNVFSPNRSTIPYQELGVRLQGSEFFFINSSCYSGTSIEALKEMKLLPKKGSVIALSPSDKTTINGDLFLSDLIDSYRKRKPFLKRKRRFLPYGYSEVTFPLDHSYESKKDESGNETVIIDKIIKPTIRYIKPEESEVLYEPVRCGKSLDHLLYPAPN